MPFPAKKFQNEIMRTLRKIYEPMDTPVKPEWSAFHDINGIYSPRIDIAIGPFSTQPGRSNATTYDRLLKDSGVWIRELMHMHHSNIKKYWPADNQQTVPVPHYPCLTDLRDHNRNARCFMAIEIENKVSRKHLLGGTVNSSALGRIAVVVGWDEEKVRALIKLLAYWEFLTRVRKGSWPTANLLVVSPKQLVKAVSTHSVKRAR